MPKVEVEIEEVTVEAPFTMPVISIPNFDRCPCFVITEFGAEPASKEKNNLALTQAIAAAKGGGRVIVPPGVWHCAQIHLQSGVNLHLEKGATLLFSEQPQDYLPAVETSWEGLECLNYSPLIYAYGCQHIAISGQGTLQAKLAVWQQWYARPPAHLEALVKLYYMAAKGTPIQQRDMTFPGAHLRPHFIHFNRCRHVLVDGVTIIDSPFWVLHPYLCQDVVVRQLKVRAHGHNNDGIDPEMTQNMLIENCEFDQGDDAISVKSGREFDAWRINIPCRNIVMRNCKIKQALQLLAVGSELAGGIENVLVENCDFENGMQIQEPSFGNLLLVKTNERRGGFVKNIHMRDIRAQKLAGGVICLNADVLYQWRDLVPTLEKRVTVISDIYLSNISVNQARFLCEIEGSSDCPAENIQLNNIHLDSEAEKNIKNVNVVGFYYAQKL